MISWDCKVKKYITIFSLFVLCQSCFGLTKKPLKQAKKTVLGNTVAYELYNQKLYCAQDFVNRYFIKNGKFVYGLDLYFSHLENFAYFAEDYIPETDDGNWVDKVLFESEEERIANEIAQMDNTDEEFQYESFDSEKLSEDIENAIEGSEKENYFLTRNETISHVAYGNEIFMLQKKDDCFVATHVNEYQIQRLFYDNNYKTLRSELWSTDASINIQNNIYEYEEDRTNPSRKIIEKLNENPPKKEFITYNSENLVSNVEVYVVVTEKSKDEEQEDINYEALIQKSAWEYDKENRVIKSVQKDYSYASGEYKKQTDVFEKKYLYRYHESTEDEEEIPADSEYYEDNIIRMRLTYKSKQNYTKQFFFDDEYNISSYYVDEKLTKEIYRIGNKVLRIKNYDN